MERIRVLAELAVRAARWALPLVVVLVVSSMLAYALDGALVAGAAAADNNPPPVNGGCGGTSEIYVGLSTWIPESSPPACENPGPLASGQ